MKYFKKPDGSFCAFEDDGSQDYLITDDMTPTTREEIDATFNPPMSAEQAQAVAIIKVQQALQAALDTLARSRNYDDIKSACAYAAPVPIIASDDPSFATCEKFRLEGNAFQIQMALTWAQSYAYLATVQAGVNPMPTPEEAVAMMPEFTWPEAE